MGGLREVAASFVVPGPAGVAIRDRLRVSEADAAVLAEVGVFLGSLAAGYLAERSRQGLAHDAAEAGHGGIHRPRDVRVAADITAEDETLGSLLAAGCRQRFELVRRPHGIARVAQRAGDVELQPRRRSRATGLW